MLTVAEGTETIDTIMNGDAVIENPEVGEVIWSGDDNALRLAFRENSN
ncbi:hypothetical protein [Rhizobium mesoamericanum]|nr:hypothetical protein [Rhizobium mesoamericanum]